MKFNKNLVSALLVGGSMAVSGQAFAHWSSGPFLYNDAGTNSMQLANTNLALGAANNGTGANATGSFGTNTGTGTSYGTYNQTRTTSSDYGWIQGQDNSLWANSHDNKGLAFSLTGTSHVSFTITTLGTATSAIQTQAMNAAGTAMNTTTTALTGVNWDPAFSIFQGLATQSSHEGGAGNSTLTNNLPGYASWSPYAAASTYTAGTDGTYESTTGNTYTGSGTWGAYRSNADWTAGRDVSATATFGNGNLIGTDLTLGGQNVRVLDYITSASSAAGAHTVTWSGDLGPGDYSIWVGGTNSANAAQQILNYQALQTATIANNTVAMAAANAAITGLRGTYGFNIQTTVSAVPVPGAVWLFGSALAGFAGLRRRKAAIQA